MIHRTACALLIALAAAGAAVAATPPALVNYQGVLRDASDKPLSGTYEMTFQFFDAATVGSEILVDKHVVADGNAVVVGGGLFNVLLGSGTVSDGSGPGTYTSLADVFRDYGTVWLSIRVGAELLTPRVQIVSAGYALNASNLGGRSASEFVDTTASSQTKAGRLTVQNGITASGVQAVEGSGTVAGGYFRDSDDTGYGYVGYGDSGVRGYGSLTGGYFGDTDNSGYAYCGYGDYGVYARGNSAGGYFIDRDNSGYVYTGYGDYGVYAQGDSAGGYFKDSDQSGYAYVGYGDYGIWGYGDVNGARFDNSAGTGYALIGRTDGGVYGSGSTYGGYFQQPSLTAYGYVGYNDRGVFGTGNLMGGWFTDHDNTGYAYVGYGDRGIWARGTFAGGTFSHPDGTTFWADVSTSTSKIKGTGAVSFVQNHPYERDKVIVYAAPEGDEVAVYTRGSARLENGVARVALGPTFALVAHPDLGLTAHLTPRGDVERLWVESVGTSELVVRGPAGANVAFDYIVYGLRIGFEDLAIVQPKTREALLPDAAAIEESYGGRAELRPFSAAARFRSTSPEPLSDSGRATSLRAAIDGDRASVIAQARAEADRLAPPAPLGSGREERPSHAAAGPGVVEAAPPIAVATAPNTAAVGTKGATTVAATAQPVVPAVMLPVAEPVEAGDVLVSDRLVPGSLRRGTVAADPRVVGIAVAPSENGTAAVATYGVVTCKVDAGFGRIAAGDLLAVSPTPGHAMRALSAEAGTILGKALEPLDAGTGEIMVLVRP